MPLLEKEYVYLLEEFESDVSTNLIKIGRTSHDVNTRIGQLKTGNARLLKEVASISTEKGTSVALEKHWHNRCQKFKTQHGGGEEWFDDSDNFIRPSFKSEAQINSSNDKLNDFSFYIKQYFEFTNGMYNSTFSFVEKEIVNNIQKKHICVFAPPKSGKRIMVKSVALHMPYAYHFFITSLDRTDIEPQIKEFLEFKIETAVLTNGGKKNSSEEIKNRIKSLAENGNEVIIHYDECDYGSHKNGKAGQFLVDLKDSFKNNDVHLIVYSATPEEAIWSDADYHLAFFKPNGQYNGPRYFEGVTEDADPFFIIENDECLLSKQARDILDEFMNSSKNYIILRLNYKLENKSAFDFAKNNLQEAIDNYRGLKSKPKLDFIGQDESFKWFFMDKDTGKPGDWFTLIPTKRILIINGTCTRSTEVGFHADIFAWHDYRKGGKKASTTYGTYAQAVGRVFHYASDYNSKERRIVFPNKDTRIKVYAERELMSVMAQIYDSSSKEEMEKIWTSYIDESQLTIRKVGIRVKSKINSKTLRAKTHIFSSYEEADIQRKIILEKDAQRIDSILDASKAKGKGSLSERKSKNGPDFCKCYMNKIMPGRQDILIHFDKEPPVEEFKNNWLLIKNEVQNKYIVFEPVFDETFNKIIKMSGNHSIHNEILKC